MHVLSCGDHMRVGRRGTGGGGGGGAPTCTEQW